MRRYLQNAALVDETWTTKRIYGQETIDRWTSNKNEGLITKAQLIEILDLKKKQNFMFH